MDKEKVYWIDALKALGILLVVIGHSGCPGVLGQFIYGFHMPLFFIISGYLFNEDKWLGKGLISFVKNRWKSYIRLYFIWALINLVLNIPIELLDNGFIIQNTIDSTLRHLWWIIVSYGGSKEFPNCTPLWFLPCLFVASFFLYGLVCVIKRKGILLALFISFLMLLANYHLGLNRDIVLPWHLDVALSSSVLMLVGYYIKHLRLLSKKTPIVILISILMIGTVAIMANGKIDMNMNQLGVQPLFYLGAISVSFFLMFIFFNAKGWFFDNIVINRIGGGQKYNHDFSSKLLFKYGL